jgi:poly(3-hydroxyalkanoate) synthetase
MKFSGYDDLKKFLQDNSFSQNMTPVADSQNSLTKIETDIYLNNVDEGDIFRVDSKYAYTLVRDELKISEANFSDSGEILSSINFLHVRKDFFISGQSLLFLD